MDNSPREPERATARIAAIALAVVALVAVLVGVTTAAAQDSEPVVVTAQTDEGADSGVSDDAEIEAAFEAFDACLVEQGLDLLALDDKAVEDGDLDEGAIELNAADEAAIDAAFEACEPILDEVEGLFDEMVFEEDPEIEAAFEAFDACLAEQGLDLEALDDEAMELNGDDEVAIDAAFEACEPILDEVEGIFFDAEFEGCDLDEDGLDDVDVDDEEPEVAPPGS